MRQGKRYLFLGMRFNRDTERMVMSDLIYGSVQPPLTAGWALIETPTDKEQRFLKQDGHRDRHSRLHGNARGRAQLAA